MIMSNFPLTRVLVVVILPLLSVHVESYQPEFCRLPPNKGLCKDALRRFFYDANSGDCQQFIYGGCFGNENNFLTISDCRNACRCTHPLACMVGRCYLPRDPGMCLLYIPRYYYNSQNKSCEFFVYGGCGGNSNNFHSRLACDILCTFGIPKQRLPPPTNQSSNTEKNQTKGEEGTGGSNNETGIGTPIWPPPECHLPKNKGYFCEGVIKTFPKFFYNRRTNMCKSFNYRGCYGNANNFISLDVCLRRCGLSARQISALGKQSRSVSPIKN